MQNRQSLYGFGPHVSNMGTSIDSIKISKLTRENYERLTTLAECAKVNLHKRIKDMLSSLNLELSVMTNMLPMIQQVQNSPVEIMIGIFYSSVVVISHPSTNCVKENNRSMLPNKGIVAPEDKLRQRHDKAKNVNIWWIL